MTPRGVGRPRRRSYRPVHRRPVPARTRRRLFGMLLVMALAFAAIGAKLVVIQGVDAQHYLAVGQSEWEQTVTLPGERGAILDRNGDELAMSIPQTTIYADPHQVTDPGPRPPPGARPRAVRPRRLQTTCRSDAGFVYLARTVDDATAAAGGQAQPGR